jgi:hypothetical protein
MIKQNFTRLLCAAALLSASTAGLAEDTAKPVQSTDPVDFSFVFFGCNRLGGKEAEGIPSTANEAQLKQDLLDIAALKPRPQYIFLAGDIVLGIPTYKPGEIFDDKQATHKLSKELNAWREMLDIFGKDQAIHDLLKDTKLVVFTGNHELLKKVSDPYVFIEKKSGDEGEAMEVPNQPAYGFWQDQIIATWEKSAWPTFVAGNDGPGKGGDLVNPYDGDHLVNSEKRLSYTLTLESPSKNKYFFVVLNTDSMVDDRTLGDIPLKWAKGKLADAQRNPDIGHIFVMGHKPIVAPIDNDDPVVAQSINAYEARDFYALLNNPGLTPPVGNNPSATKVRAYLAAHSHEWNYQPKLKFDNIIGTVPQLVAGNGGSPPVKSWQTNGYFGFTLVSVSKGNVVNLKSYGRPIPSPYQTQTGLSAANLTVSEDIYTPPPKNQAK